MTADIATSLREGREAESKFERTQAIDRYQQALQADPDHHEAGFRLAYNLDLIGEEEQAIGLLEQLCGDVKAPLNALVNLAVLYEDAGQYAKAERCLRLVLDTDPNQPRARLYLKDVQASRQMRVEDEPKPREMGGGLMNAPITDFELSARARNCLKKMNIRTVGDLARISEAELMAYKNFGETTLMEIKSVLTQRGIKLGQALDQQRTAAREQIIEQLTETAGERAVGLINQSVDNLELSVRARKALSLLGITTIGDLVARTEPELMGIKNFGSTSLDEIKAKLAERGLSLRTMDGE